MIFGGHLNGRKMIFGGEYHDELNLELLLKCGDLDGVKFCLDSEFV
jgi:hypothetical protein